MQDFSYEDCYCKVKANKLILGNSKIERTFDLSGKIPNSISLINKQQQEQWLDGEGENSIFAFPFIEVTKCLSWDVFGKIANDQGRVSEYLNISLLLQYDELKVCLETMLYPDKSFMRHALWLRAEGFGSISVDEEQFWELDENQQKQILNTYSQLDVLPIDELHTSWQCVSLYDATDINNNLVESFTGLLYPAEIRDLKGNLMFLEKTLKDSGLFLIKEGPAINGCLPGNELDFSFKGKVVSILGSGLTLTDLEEGDFIKAYGTVVGVYSGSQYDKLKAINEYHKTIHRYEVEKDSFIMSNTWGDRSRDSRVCEEFLLQELDEAKKLGIDVLQIDDGWQQGTTSNSIKPGGKWADYYSDPEQDFWAVNLERFPNGLTPIVNKAKNAGIKLGLWFSPDSTDDFAYWEYDAKRLVELYEQYDIRYFKLDGIKIASRKGQLNLLNMLDSVSQETNHHVVFNLDVTGRDKRQGYLSDTQHCSLFLENRYTDFQRYYPHFTLRNLWNLAKYIPTQKLQIEFLNVWRNKNLYYDDPLAPAKCGILYSAATTLFANPLVWMELSGLPDEDTESLAELFNSYKGIKKDLWQGHILPIGEEPTGVNWTGFQSIVTQEHGYLIIFRELNKKDKCSIPLWNLENTDLRLESIVSMDSYNILHKEKCIKEVQVDNNGNCQFELSTPLSFALYRYSVV